MKIGFNIKAISNLGDCKLVKDDKEYKKKLGKINLNSDMKLVLNKLKEEGHDIYLFAPLDKKLNKKEYVKIKNKVIINFRKKGYDFNKFAFIKDEDFIVATKRNHVDIVVDDDTNNINEIQKFTDIVNFTEDKSYNDMLEEIFENVELNRKSILDVNAKSTGVPSKDKFWLKRYRIGDFKWNKENLSPYDRLVDANKDFMDENAMEFFGKKFSYEDLINEIDNYCSKMVSMGIKKGEKVPIVVANTPESIITLYALFKAKATIVPIFPLSTKEDFESKFTDINPKFIFISDIVYGRVKDSVPENTKVIVLPVSQSMKQPQKMLFEKVLKPKLKIQSVEYDDQFIKLNDFKDNYESYDGDIDTSYEEDYAAVQLYTGGTIKPKGVLLSAKNLDASSKQFYNDRFDFRRGDKIAAFMPLNHSFGLIIGTHVATTLGVNLDLIMKIDFKKLDKLFVKDKVNIFGGIPTMFPAIRNNKKLGKADLSHVKYLLSGGSVITDEEKRRDNDFFAEHNSDAKVRDGYGKTETAGGVVYDGVVNMNTDAKIVIPGTQEELGYNQKGELCLSGPSIMMSHAKATDNPEALQIHSDGKLWLHTEDCALINEDGYINIIGRLNRMIKVNGEQVWLDEIEEMIDSVEFVEKSGVVGKKDEKRGEIPVAFIKLKPGYTWNGEVEDALQRFYETKLVYYARPRKTEFVDELSLTPLGKIDFKKLEERAEGIEMSSNRSK